MGCQRHRCDSCQNIFNPFSNSKGILFRYILEYDGKLPGRYLEKYISLPETKGQCLSQNMQVLVLFFQVYRRPFALLKYRGTKRVFLNCSRRLAVSL